MAGCEWPNAFTGQVAKSQEKREVPVAVDRKDHLRALGAKRCFANSVEAASKSMSYVKHAEFMYEKTVMPASTWPVGLWRWMSLVGLNPAFWGISSLI